ncbi:MAG: DUF177 domain-containing protein [Bacteroidia bacterium]|nr:DUF177 domain-containing protein [Bacteroidia bacterium]
MKAYSVNIIGLSNKVHHFDYEVGDRFFSEFDAGLITKGQFQVNVALNKHETFIEVDFGITGHATLTCDRSLDEFDHPIKVNRKVIFKYGDETREITDDVMMIDRGTVSLDLSQYIYEFIGLALPMKKLHPRFSEDENGEDEIMYSSSTQSEESTTPEEPVDPRWEKLKKLK